MVAGRRLGEWLGLGWELRVGGGAGAGAEVRMDDGEEVRVRIPALEVEGVWAVGE